MAGLLDFLSTPQGQGLLSGVASYAMNARRGTPVNNIGRGLAGGITGYVNANDQIRQNDENAFQKQYRQMQMDEITRKRADQEAYRAQFKPAGQADFQADNPFGEDLGALKTETPPTFAGQAIDPKLAAIAPFLDPKDMYSAMAPSEKPQLVTVYENGQPVQKWLRPGETQGVQVGLGKPDAGNMSNVGQLIAERDKLPPGHPSRRLYDDAIRKQTTHAPAAQMNNYGSPVAGIDPVTGAPVFFQTSKSGGAPSIVPGVAPPPKEMQPPSEGERTAAGYLGRMQAAEALIGQNAGGEATETTSLVGAVPKVGDYLQRKVMSPTQQKYKQAADDWIRAKLRKESGAVIADEEMAREYQTYFPQPGDSDEVITQKAQARKQAEQQLKVGAGRAAAKVPPRPGMVKDGYRFMGGDPANPKMWVKVK